MESTPSPAPRVFVDSSVLLAAVISASGSARDLVVAGSHCGATLVISSLVVREVERNLRRKARSKLPSLPWILESYPFEFVEASPDSVRSEADHVEPKDAGIVAAAVAGKVPFLVTSDERHLLSQATKIEARHGFVVCQPADVISHLTGPS